MNVGSLFSGIGGFDLGLERAGMRTVWFCEQDAYCQRVLAKHWPGVPCYPDVRSLVADPAQPGREARASNGLRAKSGREQGSAPRQDCEGNVPVSVPPVDVLCGGFPCQDLSVAGKGAGIDGERSGLWSEYARIIGELRPRYVIVENVPALLTRGFERVLGDLATLGYDAEWDCLPASAFGAPHRRDRVWVVAYPSRDLSAGTATTGAERGRVGASGQPGDVAHPEREGLQGSPRSGKPRTRWTSSQLASDDQGLGGQWEPEPNVGRVANGIPHRVDRLRALGNALVPQIAEWIGRRILAHECEAA